MDEIVTKKNSTHSSDLTARQEEILTVIKTAIATKGYPPSIREIGKAVGLQSTSSVAHQLKTLEKNGYLVRDANTPRAVNLSLTKIKSPSSNSKTEFYSENIGKTTQVPLLGQIAAGTPILAESQVAETYNLPEDLVGKGNLFMLNVVGESMIEAGIHDGDFVIIRQQPTVNIGEIAAAMIEDEATIKVFTKDKNNNVWLMPQNPHFEPINGNNATILGKVVAVFRKL